jgi:hypothetical protein
VTVKQLVAVFLQAIRSATQLAGSVTAKGGGGGGGYSKMVEFVCELFSVLVASGQADLVLDTSGEDSVVDTGCLSRIPDPTFYRHRIPDPNFPIPDPHLRIYRNYFNPKIVFF